MHSLKKHFQILYRRLQYIYHKPTNAYMIPKFYIHYFRTNKHYLALALAFFFTSFSTVNSLFLSEVLGLVPCKLCWLQRIFMYPLTFLTGIAFLKRDTNIYIYALPLALIGLILSTYHSLLQRFTHLFIETTQCSATGITCAMILRKFLGLSIPNWAFIGFLGTIISLTYLIYKT